MSERDSIQRKIDLLKDHMFSETMTNNYYHVTGQHAKDSMRLSDLEQELDKCN